MEIPDGLEAGIGMLYAAGLLLIAYFFPAIMAFAREHQNRWPVLIVNAAFGWTFIGWVVALAMAAGAVRRN